MKSKLFPTQIVDSEKMASQQDLPNFSQPGTGKTISTLAAFEQTGFETGLICCPVIAAPMWQENIERELGAKAQILSTKSTSPKRGVDFFITTYGLVTAHFDEMFEFQPDALILDESHYLKNSEADRTRAIFGEACDGIGGLYQVCRQCWPLSGTPIERYADDLWSQLRATQPEFLQRYRALDLAEFQETFCRMMLKEYGNGAVQKWQSVGNQNTGLLNRMLYKDIGIVRRTMDEVEEHMPPVTMREVSVKAKITMELRDALRGLSEEQIAELLVNGSEKGASLHRLTGIAKLPDTISYIKEIAKHRHVLVGFWHRDVGEEIYTQLAKGKCDVSYIDGSTTLPTRYNIRRQFIDGDIDVLVGQISAMGNALDGLQGAGNHVIFAEDTWAPSKIEQFWKRLWRLGQKRHVQVDFCRSNLPVDAAIRRVREDKMMGNALILTSPN